jgi:hypothetical protein
MRWAAPDPLLVSRFNLVSHTVVDQSPMQNEDAVVLEHDSGIPLGAASCRRLEEPKDQSLCETLSPGLLSQGIGALDIQSEPT